MYEEDYCWKVQWGTFEEFKTDMFEAYHAHAKEWGESNTSIDRINVDGNYSKANCRWATWKVQANNKRTSKNYQLTH